MCIRDSNNRLHPTLDGCNPLIIRGDTVANKLIKCLSILGIKNTNDINPQNVSSYNYVHI